MDDLLNECIADLKLTRSKAHAALERAKSGRASIRDALAAGELALMRA